MSNWLVASPVPRVRDWACHWPGKSLRCDAADRRKRVKVAGATFLRVLLALVAAEVSNIGARPEDIPRSFRTLNHSIPLTSDWLWLE
jgi:hypothetical protein